MALYFFDCRDNDWFDRDDIGAEFSDLEAVKFEAARALAQIAVDVIPKTIKRTLAIEVRDSDGPVMITTLIFEAIILRA